MAPPEPMFMPLADLLAETIVPPPQLVPGLIPGGSGLVILAGLPKRGKTFLALDLFTALLSGGPFLGRPVTRTPAAYVFLEGQRHAIQARLRRLIEPAASTAGHFVSIRPAELRLDRPEGRERLAAEIRVLGPRVVFIDPFVFAHELNESDNAIMGPFLRGLATYAHDLGVLLIIIHHQTKGGRDGDSRSIRGAGALAGATEANLLLSEHRRGHRLDVELRDGEDETLDLVFDTDSLRFRVVPGSAVAAASAPAAERVLRIFEATPDALEIRSIAERTDLSPTAVQTAVNELCASGRAVLLDEKRGKARLYRLARAA